MRRVAKLAQLAMLLAVVAVWAAVLRPQALGGPALFVVLRGDSMQPTYDTGDLLLLRPAASYAVGDVAAYRVPAGELGAGHLVVHRIVGGDAGAGFVLQGDNNSAPDPWAPKVNDIAGTPWLVVPFAGRVIVWLQQPVVAGAMAASLMVTWLIARPSKPAVWRTSQQGGNPLESPARRKRRWLKSRLLVVLGERG
jgi:signal peptidase